MKLKKEVKNIILILSIFSLIASCLIINNINYNDAVERCVREGQNRLVCEEGLK